jgi:hypothetical protein
MACNYQLVTLFREASANGYASLRCFEVSQTLRMTPRIASSSCVSYRAD